VVDLVADVLERANRVGAGMVKAVVVELVEALSAAAVMGPVEVEVVGDVWVAQAVRVGWVEGLGARAMTGAMPRHRRWPRRPRKGHRTSCNRWA
jgi:hypothetical protein